MIKVCILTTVHSPYDDRIYYREAITLVRAGYGVCIIAPWDCSEVSPEGIRILGLPKPRNRLSRMIGLSAKILREALHQQADVYHFHDPELLPTGWLLRQLQAGRVIYDIHEDLSAAILSRHWILPALRPIISLLSGICEHFFAHHLDGLLPTTESIAAKFDPRRVPQRVIFNYPRLAVFLGRISQKSHLSTRRDVRIAFTGGMSRIRGIHQLLEAFCLVMAEAPEARLILMGRFSPLDYRSSVLDFISRHGLEKQVSVQEPIHHLRIPEFLQSADIGIIPYLPEPNHLVTLPAKMFEYMASSLVIVASDFPLYREVVLGSNCGLVVDPTDPERIATALLKLIKDEDLRHSIGTNGRRAVEERYSWESQEAKLLDFYQQILNRKDSARAKR